MSQYNVLKLITMLNPQLIINVNYKPFNFAIEKTAFEINHFKLQNFMSIKFIYHQVILHYRGKSRKIVSHSFVAIIISPNFLIKW